MPGALAIFTPLGVGLLVGARCLGGLLMGAIASGFLLAVMMNNAGGAWDNSKKWVENERCKLDTSDPLYVGKPSEHHNAVVTGDTVGDPFKDTSGPALNILIKLMSVLCLTCAKIFRDDWKTWWFGVIVVIIEALLCLYAYYYIIGESPGAVDTSKKADEAPAGESAGDVALKEVPAQNPPEETSAADVVVHTEAAEGEEAAAAEESA